MSHDTRGCPERFERQRHVPEPSNRGEIEERKRPRTANEEMARTKASRDNQYKRREDKSVVVVEPKPLRRDLMEELGEAAAIGEKKKAPMASTREWVRKAFCNGDVKVPPVMAQHQLASSVKEKGEDRPGWLRPTVIEADIANAINAQEEQWEKVEAQRRKSTEPIAPSGPSCQIPAVRDAAKATTDRRSRELMTTEVQVERSTVETRVSGLSKFPGPGDVPKLGQSSTGTRETTKENGKSLVVGLGSRPVSGGPKMGQTDGHAGQYLGQAEEKSAIDQNVQLGFQDIISPLRDILAEAQEGKPSRPRGGPRHLPKGPRRIEQRISKALAVRKKIEHSPFRGSRIHKHASIAKEDPAPGKLGRISEAIPSSLKTGPERGKNSKELKEPVVKRKPPGDA